MYEDDSRERVEENRGPVDRPFDRWCASECVSEIDWCVNGGEK